MTRKSVSRAGATLACLAMLSVGAPTVSAKTITGNTSPQDHEKAASLLMSARQTVAMLI
ncbi:hypothetical protein [Corynebacterium ulceribovis]|uniref:hypothetical protein n=1 Tax=Corynebacterium ulceribovis TaxID=487732 RepID=UPI0003643016|nr:hypothetical protein [Corynebacterium ulceribovis]